MRVPEIYLIRLWHSMRAAIFDLDGTLADTSGDLIAAANSCFRNMGCSALLDPEADKIVAFQGGRAMLRLGFTRLRGRPPPEDEVDEQYPLLLEAYEKDIDRFTIVYPGVRGALENLISAGWVLGVCTNKPEALARKLLIRLGLLEFMRSLVGADTLPYRKPNPEPFVEAVTRAGARVENSIFVGDTEIDRDTARAAGAAAVLVAFGPAGEQLRQLDPDAMLAHYDELPNLASALVK